jgi:hypothetical protein
VRVPSVASSLHVCSRVDALAIAIKLSLMSVGNKAAAQVFAKMP